MNTNIKNIIFLFFLVACALNVSCKYLAKKNTYNGSIVPYKLTPEESIKISKIKNSKKILA